jgi:Bacterial regulatory proteins, luxR family
MDQTFRPGSGIFTPDRKGSRLQRSPYKEIASILNISPNTVESHRTRITPKLDIHDIAGLVRYALEHGLIQM